MKKFSLLILIAGLAACGDDSKKSENPNNVSNNSANNQVNNTPKNNLTGAEVTDQLWGLLCDSGFECPNPDVLPIIGRYPSAAACKAAGAPDFVTLPNFDELQSRGNATYDSAKAQTCLTAWRASICEMSFASPPPVCDEVFVGTLPEGGSCIEGTECADGRDCQRDSNACEGTCEDNCEEFNCLKTEYCSSTGCVALGAIGDECQDLDQCERGLFCIDSECAAGDSTAQGGNCQVNGECTGELICIKGKCESFAPPAADQPCTVGENSTFCEAGSVCTDLVLGTGQLEGTCGPPKKAGEECRVFYECEVGLTCDAADFATPGVCVDARANGEACANIFDCQSGVCENNVCAAPLVCQ